MGSMCLLNRFSTFLYAYSNENTETSYYTLEENMSKTALPSARATDMQVYVSIHWSSTVGISMCG